MKKRISKNQKQETTTLFNSMIILKYNTESDDKVLSQHNEWC